MAMARTVFSPRCWATSSTRRKGSPVRWSVLVVSSARLDRRQVAFELHVDDGADDLHQLAGGDALGGDAGVSAAAVFGAAGFFAAARFLDGGGWSAMTVSFGFRLERFGAGDDLDQLLGDLRLA